MDQKELDILNLMARLDREDPLNEGVESLQAVDFDSIEDATAALRAHWRCETRSKVRQPLVRFRRRGSRGSKTFRMSQILRNLPHSLAL